MPETAAATQDYRPGPVGGAADGCGPREPCLKRDISLMGATRMSWIAAVVLANKWRALAVLGGLIAFFGALAITGGQGPGLDPDSMAYVGSATSLASGHGLRVPLGKWDGADSTVALTVWPPAFPIAMALPQLGGTSPIASARVTIALAAAMTGILLVLLLGGAASIEETAVVAGIVMATPAFISVHLSVLSEPLFLASLMLTLYGMSRERPVLAGTGAVIAVMTRYAGVSAAAAAAAWFLFFSRGTIGERVRRASIASVPAAAAFVGWMVHNSRVAVVQSPIRLAYHPGTGETIRQGLAETLDWIAPGAARPVALIIAVFLFALVAAAAVKNIRAKRGPGFSVSSADDIVAQSAAILLASYVAVILLSRAFVGGSIRFDQRILAPAFLLAEVGLAAIFLRALRTSPSWLRAGAVAVAAVWIAAAVRSEGPVVLDSIQDGNDFAAGDWRASPTVEWVRGNGAHHPIFTNWPAEIYFNADRIPFDIPSSADADSLALFRKKLFSADGFFVAFDVRNTDYPPSDSIARGAGLSLLKRFDDGSIWMASRR